MIHKTAIIDSKAKIASNVNIGAFSVIGPNVEIGENSIVQSHVSILGNTKIWKNNKNRFKYAKFYIIAKSWRYGVLSK